MLFFAYFDNSDSLFFLCVQQMAPAIYAHALQEDEVKKKPGAGAK